MQGRKTSDENIEKAKVLLCAGMSTAEVEKQTGIKKRTVQNIMSEVKDTDEFALLCQERKKRFQEKAWEIIEHGQNVIKKSILELESQDSVSPADMQRVSTVMCQQYDKQALSSGEATEIIAGGLNITRFEDL